MMPTKKSVLQSEEDALLREVHFTHLAVFFLLEVLELEWWQKDCEVNIYLQL